MKKKICALVLSAFFVHLGCVPELKASTTKKFIHEAQHVIDDLNESLKEILKKGSANGYKLLNDVQINFSSIPHEAPLAKELAKVSDYIRQTINPLLTIIKKRPDKKDHLTYVMQFKNKVDLITVMTQLVTSLNQLHQEALKQGHTEDAAHIKEFAQYIEKIKNEWTNISVAEQSKMMANLLKALE
jgi:Na+/phosphate symporter